MDSKNSGSKESIMSLRLAIVSVIVGVFFALLTVILTQDKPNFWLPALAGMIPVFAYKANPRDVPIWDYILSALMGFVGWLIVYVIIDLIVAAQQTGITITL